MKFRRRHVIKSKWCQLNNVIWRKESGKLHWKKTNWMDKIDKKQKNVQNEIQFRWNGVFFECSESVSSRLKASHKEEGTRTFRGISLGWQIALFVSLCFIEVYKVAQRVICILLHLNATTRVLYFYQGDSEVKTLLHLPPVTFILTSLKNVL